MSGGFRPGGTADSSQARSALQFGHFEKVSAGKI